MKRHPKFFPLPTAQKTKLSFCTTSSEEHNKLIKLREVGDFDTLEKYAKEIVRFDLSLVDRSDIIILYINTDIHTTGSYGEFVTACNERKPVMIICKQGKNKIPIWLFGRLSHKYMFNNIEELIVYLKTLAFAKPDEFDKMLEKRFTTLKYKI